MTGVPPADVLVSVEQVRGLLSEQHYDLAAEPIESVATGWDNFIFRLGTDLAVRLPRRAEAAELVLNEQRWLPVLAPRLSLAVPAPRRMGVPGCGYPWHWSIVPWFDGACADTLNLDASAAHSFARFLHELHQPAPADAPTSSVRGVPLAERATVVHERMGRLRRVGPWVPHAIEDVWHAALLAPPSAAPVWVHGDLHAFNVLGREDRIEAVIDWGDVTAGDPATDLASAWMLFDDREARRALFDVYAPSQALLSRARGWAVSFGTMLLASGLVNSPRHAEVGAATLRRLAADL